MTVPFRPISPSFATTAEAYTWMNARAVQTTPAEQIAALMLSEGMSADARQRAIAATLRPTPGDRDGMARAAAMLADEVR